MGCVREAELIGFKDQSTVLGEWNIVEGDSQVSALGHRTRKFSVLFTLSEIWHLQRHAGRKLLLLSVCFEEEDELFSLVRAWCSLDNHFLEDEATVLKIRNQAEDLLFLCRLLRGGSLVCSLSSCKC